MNENNRQFGYSSQQNKNNYYIDDIRFDNHRTGFAKQRQMSYVVDRFASVSDILNHIRPDSQIIKNIRTDMTQNPSKYSVPVNVFLRGYENIFVVINNICLIYNQTGNMTDKIFNGGFSTLNDRLYNDLVDGKLNAKAFVNGVVAMGNSLAPYYTPIKEGPNSERGC